MSTECEFTGDVLFAVTTNGCGDIYVENADGEIVARGHVATDSDDEFTRVAQRLIADAVEIGGA